MKRTAGRPLPAGRLDPQTALQFGVGLAAFSLFLMLFASNWQATLLLAASILFYVFVYTMWLKPRTPQNIVIGRAAGALPPFIGWVTVPGTIAQIGNASRRARGWHDVTQPVVTMSLKKKTKQ